MPAEHLVKDINLDMMFGNDQQGHEMQGAFKKFMAGFLQHLQIREHQPKSLAKSNDIYNAFT